VSEQELYAAILEASRTDPEAVVCTVVVAEGSAPREPGAKMLVRGDGSLLGTIGGGALELAVAARAAEVAREGRPSLFEAHLSLELAMCCGGRVSVFLEPVQQRQDLLIFGAGHVGSALCRMGMELGFAVTAVDEREGFANALGLVDPHRALDAEPMDVWDELPWGPRCYAVVMTHSHALDQAIVERALAETWSYLGLIGSLSKVRKFRRRLRDRGITDGDFDRIHAPIGVDIGAETPGEIACAVAAELVAVRHGGGVAGIEHMRDEGAPRARVRTS
jgi:xanthine dehydrogenase accessory factor